MIDENKLKKLNNKQFKVCKKDYSKVFLTPEFKNFPDEITGKILYINELTLSDGIILCQNFFTGYNPKNNKYKYGYWVSSTSLEYIKILDREEKLKRLLNG